MTHTFRADTVFRDTVQKGGGELSLVVVCSTSMPRPDEMTVADGTLTHADDDDL